MQINYWMIAVMGVALPLLLLHRLDHGARRAYQRQHQQQQHRRHEEQGRQQEGRAPAAGPWPSNPLDLPPLVPFSGFVLLDLYLAGTLVWTLLAAPALPAER